MFFRLATEKNHFTKVTTAAYGNEMHLYNYLSQQKRDKCDALWSPNLSRICAFRQY